MRTEIAVCRGWASVASLLAVNGFASCRLQAHSKHAITQNWRTPLFPSSKKMSGAGYDVVVDVDEEVSASW
jgi:hypothetical protein